ncbi:YdcF family protein [Mucilaginibacter achroorhodeus]|uniref:YdcF family protein n=1 Tax=Mucilaginibacter achroorhodeus TaxID=2599294 RepID=A0A563UB70_9SPHI|nr:YdcF family protein [Mucilaginibacter achroorhodeus]TWR28595.1 YdcF family protein [Mucilaginibacter achroorhodeus]
MYFILSKVLFLFAMPVFWAFVLLVYAAFSKKYKQRLLVAGIAVFYFFSVRLTVDTFGRLWDVKSANIKGKQYSSVILLGGFVSEDENGNGYFNGASPRYNSAVKLFKEGTAKHILFTGGNGKLRQSKFTEAAFVKDALHLWGVPDSLILLDNKARNTEENAKFSKELLLRAKLKPPYVLVTSAYHMRRAQLLFEKNGLEVLPYPCNYLEAENFDTGTVIPSAEAMASWNIYIKEVIGYIVALIR